MNEEDVEPEAFPSEDVAKAAREGGVGRTFIDKEFLQVLFVRSLFP